MVWSIFFTLFIATASALANDANWTPLVSKSHPNCDEESSCRVLERDGAFEVKLVVKTGPSSKTVKKIEIRNLKSGTIQSFSTNRINNIDLNDLFHLYQVKMRPSGEIDLALWAYDSAKEGPVYFYFIYDKKNQKFVFSDDTFPKLNYDAKTRYYISDIQNVKYSINDNLKPIQVIAK